MTDKTESWSVVVGQLHGLDLQLNTLSTIK